MLFIFSFFFFKNILDTPWMLYGIIITLSVGYVIALVGGIVYGCVKCIQFTNVKILQFRNKRREQTAPTPIELRQMQQNVQQLQQELQQV